MDAEARLVAAWEYPPPFDIYNGDPNGVDDFVARSTDGYGYYAVVDPDRGDELVGYCCLGPEARVSGQAHEVGTLDVGGWCPTRPGQPRTRDGAFPLYPRVRGREIRAAARSHGRRGLQ
jgi:hypothetical protein